MQAVEIDKATTLFYTYMVLKTVGYKPELIALALAADIANDDKEDKCL